MHMARHARTNALSSRLCKRSCRNAILCLVLLLTYVGGHIFIIRAIRKDNRQPTSKHRLHADINSKKNTSSTNLSGGLPDSNPTPVHFRKDIGGVRNQTVEYGFVISQYDEGLDWLRPIANHSHVYHKGQDEGPPFQVYKWEKLPNVGREGHTYLYHIIHNYDNLANVTVFLQGHGPSAHKSSRCFAPMEFVTKAKAGRFCKLSGSFRNWGRMRHFGKWLKSLQTGKMRKARCTVGEFYTAVFGTPPPTKVPVCFTGCFAATRESLRRPPRRNYQNAISFLDDHPDPEEGHYMERLWATVIYAKNAWGGSQ